MQEKSNPEFQTMVKAAGNHCTIFHTNIRQFTDHDEIEAMENDDRLYPEKTVRFPKRVKYILIVNIHLFLTVRKNFSIHARDSHRAQTGN